MFGYSIVYFLFCGYGGGYEVSFGFDTMFSHLASCIELSNV